MSDVPLTEEETMHVADIVNRMKTAAGLLTGLFPPEEVELMRRGLPLIKDEVSRNTAQWIVYQAQGLDPDLDAQVTYKEQVSTILTLMTTLLENTYKARQEEERLRARMEQREQLRDKLKGFM